MSYIFIKTQDFNNPHDNYKVELEIFNNSESLDVILERFADFLKACGFSIKGELEVIEDEGVTLQ